MRLINAIPKPARTWWWGFGLLIGIPVTGLAILGLRMVDLERVQRSQQVAEQQSQTALLVDTSVAAVLNRIERELAQPGLESASGGTLFTLDRAGSLVLPADRVYFAEIGSEPVGRPIELQAGIRRDVERAQSAEAQGNSAEAAVWYKRLSNDARLKAWAALALARMDMRQRPEALLGWAGATNQDWGAMSPSGIPVTLIAASYTEQLPLNRRAEFVTFLIKTLDRLRSGAWWLGYAERKLQDAELRRLIRSTGASEPPVDSRLAEISSIERAIRLAPLRRDIAVRSLMGGPEPLLVFGAPDPREQSRWKGSVLSTAQMQTLLSRALGPIAAGVSYPLMLRDGNGRQLWASNREIGRNRVFPLRALSGWELVAGDSGFENSVYRTLFWYGFIALLVLVLALGLVMTMRIVNREMELARLHTEFAAGVTHEFKSPITSIRLLMERIASGRVTATGSLRDYADAVGRETERLEQLVNRLLSTHKIQAGQNRYHIAPHSVFDIAQAAVARLDAQANAKTIRVHLDADDIAREIPLDRTAIQDSLQNLIDNAIKYSPPDTAIEITIRHCPDEVCIAVRDQGIGIDRDDLPRVFDRFYRAKRGGTQSVSGTGLGLWLVRSVAEGHGGRVDVQSQPGEGSVFCLRIPIREEDQCLES